MTILTKLFRNGIFLLQTARLGKVAEIMIKKKYNLSYPPQATTKYDLWDSNNSQRIEIKFSTVRQKDDETITESTIIEKCLTAKWQNTPIKYNEYQKKKFNRNIEQIKPSEFDILYYGLFFWDNILIFKVDAKTITSIQGWSNRMHRGQAKDYVEGQFHITNENLQYHINNFKADTFTYELLYKLVNPYHSTLLMISVLLKKLLKLWKR